MWVWGVEEWLVVVVFGVYELSVVGNEWVVEFGVKYDGFFVMDVCFWWDCWIGWDGIS